MALVYVLVVYLGPLPVAWLLVGVRTEKIARVGQLHRPLKDAVFPEDFRDDAKSVESPFVSILVAEYGMVLLPLPGLTSLTRIIDFFLLEQEAVDAGPSPSGSYWGYPPKQRPHQKWFSSSVAFLTTDRASKSSEDLKEVTSFSWKTDSLCPLGPTALKALSE